MAESAACVDADHNKLGISTHDKQLSEILIYMLSILKELNHDHNAIRCFRLYGINFFKNNLHGAENTILQITLTPID